MKMDRVKEWPQFIAQAGNRNRIALLPAGGAVAKMQVGDDGGATGFVDGESLRQQQPIVKDACHVSLRGFN